MKKIPKKVPLIGTPFFLTAYALTLLPTSAATANTNDFGSLCPKTNESIRVLIASSVPVAAIAEEDDFIDDSKKQIAASLPISAAPPIDMNVKQKVVRPDYIPAAAFTNDEMVAPYHETDSGKPVTTSPQELPKRIKLDPKVAKHWTGAKVEPCWVITTPDATHPGTYSFCSEVENGPKGWLLHTGERSAWGHPEYRYWFDPT
ncbi:MAG TPA: hypothetical protein V6C89_04705 [Drouetiella sp.]|jgi:hypothetical protein